MSTATGQTESVNTASLLTVTDSNIERDPYTLGRLGLPDRDSNIVSPSSAAAMTSIPGSGSATSTRPGQESQESSLKSLTLAQHLYEQRFNCVVCLDAKLQMVYGICQHKVCADCLYKKDGTLKASMEKCPLCTLQYAFPHYRPDIPDDNIETQKCLGVRECPYTGCSFQTWQWEMDDHVKVCLHGKPKVLLTPQDVSVSKTKAGRCKTKKQRQLRTYENPYRRSPRRATAVETPANETEG